MSNFVVSARKYRPNRFDDVVGQGHVSQTLKNALQNDHLAHAFLFCGPRGVGKTTCARILAKVLNCQNITEAHEPCNTCDSCEAFNNNASFNITELDAASNNSVDHIRALIEQVRFQPQQGQYKVFIIDEVHMLSQQAFNAFLKTLEEPPSYAIFILATTEKHKIIPTILSRCQIFDFRRIQVQDMVKHLETICKEEGIEAEKEALHIIAQKADGALRDSLSIFDRIVSFSGKSINYQDVISNLNILDYDYYFKIVDALLASDMANVLVIFNDILKKGFEPSIFINGLAEHIRNLLVCKNPKTLALLEVSDSLQARYQTQVEQAPNSFLLTALNLANDCDVNYRMARNKRLHVEMTIIKMAHIAQAVDLSQQALPAEKKNPSVSPIAPTNTSTPPKTVEKPTPVTIKEKESPAPAVEQVQASPVESPPQPPVSEPKSNAKKSLLGNKKKIMPLSSSIEEVEKSVIEDDKNKDLEEKATLTLENLQKAWNSYVETVTSPSVRSTLKRTELQLEDKHVIAIVGSKLAEGHLTAENDLMDHLRDEFKVLLTREIRIDESKAIKHKQPAKPQILTVKDKFRQMEAQNPLVRNLCLKFDLRPNEK